MGRLETYRGVYRTMHTHTRPLTPRITHTKHMHFTDSKWKVTSEIQVRNEKRGEERVRESAG